jgi:hypothetical protein
MSMVQCASGHFYNPSVNASCPHCQNQGSSQGKTFGITPPQQQNSFQNNNAQKTVGQPNIPEGEITGGKPIVGPPSNEGKTIGLFAKKAGIDPVVGWFVCIEGKDRGQDYRIHTEKNTIGRSASNDIQILGDNTISRDNHATVVYDPKKKDFRLLAGGGRGIVYVNDEAVDYSTPLKKGDIIELGESKIMFVPLCGSDFDW